MAEELKIAKLKTGKDRISSLPEQAINKILGSLPIRDAISTSFLSKRWRYKWRSMSDLIFHSDSFSRSERVPPSSFTRTYMSKVHRILFFHRGDIQMFKFDSSDSKIINSEVDLWLDYLVDASVQQLVLKFTKEYLIHSVTFRFDKLITLDLTFCKITLPASFDGFKLLTNLHLRSITFENVNTLETLINLCPLLKDLEIQILLGCPQRLILHAANLRSLTINGFLSYLEFKETRMMTDVELMLIPSEFLYNFANILSSLSNVNYLIFWSSENMKSVFKGVVFSPLMIENITFKKLKTLYLGVNLNCSKETSIVFCILKNCSSLTYLEIYCEEEDGTSLSTSDEFLNDQRNFSFSSFDNLKEFDITNVHGSKSELRFIKYILGKAPWLKVSNIKIDWSTIAFGERKMVDILIELLSFERISNAKVIIDEPESN